MKHFTKRGLLSALALTFLVAEASAGGMLEEEPVVQTPEAAPAARPVVLVQQTQVDCVFVPVAVHVEPAQTYVNQGLSVLTNCCCGAITIAGSSVTLAGSRSVQQEQDCDAEGKQ